MTGERRSLAVFPLVAFLLACASGTVRSEEEPEEKKAAKPKPTLPGEGRVFERTGPGTPRAGAGPELKGRNPFMLQTPGKERTELVPFRRAVMPTGIRVVGILHVKNRPCIAVLDIPGTGHLHFVREGEVVQIDQPSTKSATAAKKGKKRGAPERKAATSRPDEPLYLLIRKITDKQVEVAPRTRPEDARILR